MTYSARVLLIVHSAHLIWANLNVMAKGVLQMKRISKYTSRFILLMMLGLASFSGAMPAFATPAQCLALMGKGVRDIIDARGQAMPARSEITIELAKFASENNLPTKWVEVGPPERRIKRLFVALDQNNAPLMKKYLETFNLTKKLNNDVAGTLALEFQQEKRAGQDYVTGVLRPGAGVDDPIYRWGRPDLTRSNWWQVWMNTPTRKDPNGIVGYGHLIGLDDAEQANVAYYLQHSDVNKPDPEVCAPKAANCVAWAANIELGRTAKDATSDERKHLFNELGVARAMAHFEIGRRLIHAANDRHTAIITFIDGPKGLDTFNNHLAENLPLDPKMPYASIIRGLQLASPAAAAVKVIPDGAKVFVPIAAGASPEALEALIDQTAFMKKGVDVHVLVNGVSANTFKRGVETTDGKFRVHALFLGSNLRQLYKENKVAVIPGNLSDFVRLVQDPTQPDFQYDTMLVRVSKPNVMGRYSLGPNNDMIMSIIKARPGIKIIAEVNPNVPFTNGDNFITENQITAKFESKTALAGPPVVLPNEVDTKIGVNLASLIDSGANLQIGIGNIFGGLVDGMKQYKRSGIQIWTEMMGDPMMDMIRYNIATKAETGFAYGSDDLYRWLDHNDKVTFRETAVVNDPAAIAAKPKFHAVNTALQVNLFGEVNATMGPDGRMSSPGGQVEFMTGASRSPGGKAIIAIRSTAKDGQLSSITLDLYPGPITTPHEAVSHVVTEYGIAELRGKSETQRAVALISIAHPKFRQQLIDQAIARRIITLNESKSIPLQ